MPKTDQGINRERYMVIPRTLIFVRRDNQVLLLKGAPTKRLWANQYNGVGGHVERGEDILSAARRELHEETGLDTGEMRLAGTMIVDAGEDVGVCVFVFTAEYQGGEVRPSPEGDLDWIPLDRLDAFPLVADLRHLLRRLFLSPGARLPFSARSYYDDYDRQIVEFIDQPGSGG